MTRTFNRRRAGQSLVELALVVPILLLLFMGTVEVGRLAFAQIALEEAVQEGATYAAQVPTDSAGIIARVTTSIDHPEVTGATVSAPACTSNAISVSATDPLALITPLGDVLFGGTFQIAAAMVATNLTGTCS